MLTNLRSGAAVTAARLNVPRSVDVSFAHGALTHTNGHGFEVYEALALGIVPEAKAMAVSRAKIAASRVAEGDAYDLVDDAAMLDAKWPQILAGKPAFLKVHLVGSERFAAKRSMIDSIALGDIGIDPALLPEIVSRAHAAGLRVSAHVETITDYRVALASGVDEIAHLPGYYLGDDEPESLKRLSIADARETARRGTWVVVSPVAMDYELRQQARVNALVAFNLRLLKDAGAKIALGSDRYGRSPRDDGLRLATLGVFSKLEVLKLWTEATPQTIFPGRRLGQLKAGYEASFLALTGNPLDDFTKITTIVARMKQGVLLDTARR